MEGLTTGLSASLNKQYAVTNRQLSKTKVEGKSEDSRGTLSDGDLSELSNPTAEYFAAVENISKRKKVHDSSIKDLEERLEKMLVEKYDNAHNMLAEAFSDFKAGICQTVMNLKGADPAKIAEIRRRAYETAKKNVRLGFERLAMAQAEFEVYVS